MSRRESTLAGWFATCIGAGVLAISLHGAIFVGAPPSTNSLTRSALIQGLVGIFGTSGGRIAFHLIYAAGGAGLLWVGVKILQDRSP